jgi:hypothetical protein
MSAKETGIGHVDLEEGRFFIHRKRESAFFGPIADDNDTRISEPVE